MNFKLNRALKSALLVGALVVGAAPAAFADFTQTDVNALTPGAFGFGDNGALSFNLYSTSGTTNYSYAQNLGFTFNQVFTTPTLTSEISASDPDSNLDAPGTTLTWTISNFGSGTAGINFASLLGNGQLAWSVVATNTGATATSNSIEIATTVDQATSYSGATAAGVTGSVLNALTNTINSNYTNYNASPALNPVAIQTTGGAEAGYNSFADLNSSALDTSNVLSNTGAGGTLNFYGFANNGLAGSNASDYFQYAGTWAFSIVNGIGTLVYSVPGGSEVPLPAAVWLLLSGLGGLGVIGRRKPAALAA